MGGLHSKTPTAASPKKKRNDAEKRFAAEIYKSVLALDDHYTHNFDDVGKVVGQASRRPADREVVWQGRHFLLELKVTATSTLPFSSFDRGKDNPRHQCKTLIAQQKAGGFGLVLVLETQARRCWVIPAPVLEAHGLHEGAKGSFALGAPFTEVPRVAHPRGHDGKVWDLAGLFTTLMEFQS